MNIQPFKQYFKTGVTHDVSFRRTQLKKLYRAINDADADIIQALKADLGKSPMEAFGAEIGLVLSEISLMLRNVRTWARPKRAVMSIAQFPSSGWVYSQPYGVALVMGPWNYPFLLMMAPLVAAIAAGNCVVLKPSELAPHTSALIARLIANTFDPNFIATVEGGADIAQALLDQPFDYIFYTGNPNIGKIVMSFAAKRLIPLTLELGGKSPAIVEADANIDHAAQRIAFGKCYNAGQTCVAPDYVLANRAIAPALIEKLKRHIIKMYGENPQLSPDYGRIVNARHFSRICGLLAEANVVFGGQTDPTERYIAPTLVTNPAPNSPLLSEEIFGPILPIIEYDTLDDAFEWVNKNPNPLAAYFFSQNSTHKQRFLRMSFGGGIINDTTTHLTESNLPFGGIGNSGMGTYRGKAGFDAFTHKKGVIFKSSLATDLLVRYPPYSKLKLALARLILR